MKCPFKLSQTRNCKITQDILHKTSHVLWKIEKTQQLSKPNKLMIEMLT